MMAGLGRGHLFKIEPSVRINTVNSNEPMDIDALSLFLRLARTLHFGKTAAAAHVSTSTLSRAIGRLEEELGVRLFERDKRSVSLTPNGLRLVTYAQKAVGDWQELRQQLATDESWREGALSIFASVTACQTFLPPALTRFRSRFPKAQIQLETGYAANALERVKAGEVDAAVAAVPPTAPEGIREGLRTRVLLSIPLVLVAPAATPASAIGTPDGPIAASKPPWGELPLVSTGPRHPAPACRPLDKDPRRAPRVYGEAPGNEAILSLVSLGCGVGIVPRLVLQQSPLATNVREIPVIPPIGDFDVGIVVREPRLSDPLMAAFWDSLSGPQKPDQANTANTP